jgi:hypothetical protein
MAPRSSASYSAPITWRRVRTAEDFPHDGEGTPLAVAVYAVAPFENSSFVAPGTAMATRAGKLGPAFAEVIGFCACKCFSRSVSGGKGNGG